MLGTECDQRLLGFLVKRSQFHVLRNPSPARRNHGHGFLRRQLLHFRQQGIQSRERHGFIHFIRLFLHVRAGKHPEPPLIPVLVEAGIKLNSFELPLSSRSFFGGP